VIRSHSRYARSISIAGMLLMGGSAPYSLIFATW